MGDCVEHMYGWRDYAIIDSRSPEVIKHDPNQLPWQYYLGIAGMPGMTAHAGLLLLVETTGKDTVFVSGAAGAVGSVVCQIAKLKGCHVIASAGSDDKVQWLKDHMSRSIPVRRFEFVTYLAIGRHC